MFKIKNESLRYNFTPVRIVINKGKNDKYLMRMVNKLISSHFSVGI